MKKYLFLLIPFILSASPKASVDECNNYQDKVAVLLKQEQTKENIENKILQVQAYYDKDCFLYHEDKAELMRLSVLNIIKDLKKDLKKIQ